MICGNVIVILKIVFPITEEEETVTIVLVVKLFVPEMTYPDTGPSNPIVYEVSTV